MNKIVSVIIPLYNVNNLLVTRCIESVLKQTYKNIEILIIDDGTNQENKELIKEYQHNHSNICIFEHEKNKGLFQARITGVKKAKGEYIAFVDADDYIAIDWIRLLVNKAEKCRADITMANVICENESGLKYVINAGASFLKDRDELEKDKIFELLLEDEGRYFPIHTVWNKLYSRTLWEKVLKAFENFNRHLIMTEDILFSIALFFYAEKMAFSFHDGYFYYRNGNSSTIDTSGINKVEKNVDDLIFVFDYVKGFMIRNNVYKQYKDNYSEWKARYFRWWSNNVKNNTTDLTDSKQKNIREKFLSFFEKDDFENPIEDDDFFSIYTTKWDPKLEEIKEYICSKEVDVISFDIFDTLILRPVLEPDDIFEILQYENPINGKYIFKEIRKSSEERARKEEGINNPQNQDITINQIYQTMSKYYKLDPGLCDVLLQKENNLEIELAYTRKIGKELYELAAYLGKKIILVSDMYLTSDTIDNILRKTGYAHHEKLYLSSDRKALKSTGKLFAVVREDYPEAEYKICHIGDNWNSDFITPQHYKIKSFFLPKTKDVLLNTLGDKYTGNSVGYAVSNYNSIVDLKMHLKKLNVKCLYAVAANIMFDNPFIPYNDNSDYNGDPYLIGNIAVGSHLFGINNWLIHTIVEKKHKKIHFTSRDGYYLFKAYELMKRYWYHDAPDADYIYVSRKAMIPIDVQNQLDIETLFAQFSWQGQSPRSVINTYQNVLHEMSESEIEKYKRNGFSIDNVFNSKEECISFLKYLYQNSFDLSKAKKSLQNCSDYFQRHISKGDAIFDLGYSGKIQTSMIKALGYPIDGYYVHHSGLDAVMREKENNFNIYTYYNFIPSMSGAITEFIMSDYNPSCIGYKKNEEYIQPVFENKKYNPIQKYIVDEIHRGANTFLVNLLELFKNHKNLFDEMQCTDASLQFERFLMCEKKFDLELFRCCPIEDEYYGGICYGKLLDVWQWQINDRNLFRSANKEIVKEIVYVPGEDQNPLDIYSDGVFIDFYKKLNKIMPIGSKRRERVKKIMGRFLRK